MTILRSKHDCKIELNEVMLRATPARMAALEFLEKTETPVDIQTIRTYLYQKNISADLATIFRMMNAFTKKGITKQISFNEGKFRYELANKPEHHHLVCVSCKGIESFSDCAIPSLELDIKKKKKFQVKSHALEFYGICKNCQK